MAAFSYYFHITLTHHRLFLAHSNRECVWWGVVNGTRLYVSSHAVIYKPEQPVREVYGWMCRLRSNSCQWRGTHSKNWEALAGWRLTVEFFQLQELNWTATCRFLETGLLFHSVFPLLFSCNSCCLHMLVVLRLERRQSLLTSTILFNTTCGGGLGGKKRNLDQRGRSSVSALNPAVEKPCWFHTLPYCMYADGGSNTPHYCMFQCTEEKEDGSNVYVICFHITYDAQTVIQWTYFKVRTGISQWRMNMKLHYLSWHLKG